MLVVGRGQFAAHFRWFLGCVAVLAASVAWYWMAARESDRWPGGGSQVGLSLGVASALMIAFEMLIWPRKRFPKLRTMPLLRTQHWMKAHIWLGLLCVPLAVLHAGFRLGGTLTTTLSAVFAVVIASGIWGLLAQHIIPRRLLALVPDEVPATEIERVMAVHTLEFERKLVIDRGKFGGPELPGIAAVAEFFEADARPYLLGERVPQSLATADRAADVFEGLLASTPAASRPRVDDLRELCALRRQFDTQLRLQTWLHNWVWVHLPLSLTLVGLLVLHIYTALRYL